MSHLSDPFFKDHFGLIKGEGDPLIFRGQLIVEIPLGIDAKLVQQGFIEYLDIELISGAWLLRLDQDKDELKAARYIFKEANVFLRSVIRIDASYFEGGKIMDHID